MFYVSSNEPLFFNQVKGSGKMKVEKRHRKRVFGQLEEGECFTVDHKSDLFVKIREVSVFDKDDSNAYSLSKNIFDYFVENDEITPEEVIVEIL